MIIFPACVVWAVVIIFKRVFRSSLFLPACWGQGAKLRLLCDTSPWRCVGKLGVKAAFVAGEHLSMSGLCGFFLRIAAWLVVGGQIDRSSDATINT